MADETNKARVQRSRAACTQCRQHKQKCDGPSRIPCRRCELYNLDCTYLPATVTPTVARSADSKPPSLSSHAPGDTLVSDRLREISDRLRSIESSLSNVHFSRAQVPPLPNSSKNSSHQTAPSSRASSPSQGDVPPSTLHNPHEHKPDGEQFCGRRFALDGLISIDVIDRGIMSVEEVNLTFEAFHRLLSPWLGIFDQERDGDAMVVRDRCPLLFHVVLLSTSYYRLGTSTRSSWIYHSLVGIVNELLAPMLMSTLPNHLTVDLFQALCVLVLYKPVQFVELHAAGIKDPVAAEQAAKLNATSSAAIWGLLLRTSSALNLASVPDAVAKAHQTDNTPSPSLLRKLRLWIWIVMSDTHSCLQTGRTSSFNTTDLLRVTRIFASLKSQVWDVRLAATSELYGIVGSVISSPWYTSVGGTGNRTPAYELRKFNREVDEWEAFWSDKLEEATRAGDSLAGTVVFIFSNFIRIIVNSSVFTRWKNDRKESLARGGNGQPELLKHDWQFIQIVLNSMEHLIFSVSVESRVEGSATKRKVQWPELERDEPRKPLTLDENIVGLYRTALDAVPCVLYIYPLILVVKMVNAGLIRCELSIEGAQVDYALGIQLQRPRRLVSGAKFGVLIELGAKLLDAIAATPSHPARRHSRMLRAIFAAGTIGQTEPVGPRYEGFQERLHTVLQPTQLAALAPIPPPTTTTTAAATSTTSYTLPEQHSIHEEEPELEKEAGEALASILGNLSSGNYFGDAGAFGDMNMEGAFDGLEGMEIDWDNIGRQFDPDTREGGRPWMGGGGQA